MLAKLLEVQKDALSTRLVASSLAFPIIFLAGMTTSDIAPVASAARRLWCGAWERRLEGKPVTVVLDAVNVASPEALELLVGLCRFTDVHVRLDDLRGGGPPCFVYLPRGDCIPTLWPPAAALALASKADATAAIEAELCFSHSHTLTGAVDAYVCLSEAMGRSAAQAPTLRDASAWAEAPVVDISQLHEVRVVLAARTVALPALGGLFDSLPCPEITLCVSVDQLFRDGAFRFLKALLTLGPVVVVADGFGDRFGVRFSQAERSAGGWSGSNMIYSETLAYWHHRCTGSTFLGATLVLEGRFFEDADSHVGEPTLLSEALAGMCCLFYSIMSVVSGASCKQ